VRKDAVVYLDQLSVCTLVAVYDVNHRLSRDAGVALTFISCLDREPVNSPIRSCEPQCGKSGHIEQIGVNSEVSTSYSGGSQFVSRPG
jgi:hypothetical protein